MVEDVEALRGLVRGFHVHYDLQPEEVPRASFGAPRLRPTQSRGISTVERTS
jgi:hypothetical protein